MAAQTAFPPMHFPVAVVGVLIGIVILFFGRKLFWLCVAAVGFAVGVEIAPQLFHEPSTVLALVIAIVFGVLGALLALFLQKVAIAVLGFLTGPGRPRLSCSGIHRDTTGAQGYCRMLKSWSISAAGRSRPGHRPPTRSSEYSLK